MSTIMWCIHCEREVNVETSSYDKLLAHNRGRVSYNDKTWEDDWCHGPFISSPPPVMTEEMWDEVISRDITNADAFPEDMSDGLGI